MRSHSPKLFGELSICDVYEELVMKYVFVIMKEKTVSLFYNLELGGKEMKLTCQEIYREPPSVCLGRTEAHFRSRGS